MQESEDSTGSSLFGVPRCLRALHSSVDAESGLLGFRHSGLMINEDGHPTVGISTDPETGESDTVSGTLESNDYSGQHSYFSHDAQS